MDAGRGSDPAMKRTTVERKSDRELVVTRTIDGPARLVFAAWTKAELFQRWWVPRSMGMKLESCEMDVRAGGRYRLVFGQGAEFFGRYLEVAPPARLSWTNEEAGEAGSITTVTFEERDGRTLVTLSELFPSKEAFEAGAGAADAMDESFGQLEELLVTLAADGT